ncbi:MMPL family transporter [Streptacidiphilus sp. MAP5-3]|uniref:MMPL family transporter n=1 Tax=unclassified Streptacidiphilus TaxID=2643834 RepID=UPI0035111110
MSNRSRLTVAVGDWSARHRKTAVFGWLLFVVLATTLGSMAGTKNTTDADNGVGESGRAVHALAAAGLAQPAAESVFIQAQGFTATDPRFHAIVDASVAAVEATGRVAQVQSPYTSGALSADGHSALVEFVMTGDPDTVADRVQPVLDAVAKVQSQHPEATVVEYGTAGATKEFNDTFNSDFAGAEWTAVPLALGILLIVFGALVAALLPVVLAVTAFTGAFGLVALTTRLVPTSSDASSVMLLVGLAVGVDYCLFYLSREREERAAGKDPHTALRIAAETSGHSVLVSGLTVMVAMAGMFLTGIADFRAMGVATIVVVLVAVLGSLTVLPALLSMLGDKVDRLRIPFLGRRRPSPEGGRLLAPVLRTVLARPLISALVATLALLGLAVPVLGMHTAQLTAAQELPSTNAVVRTGEQIAKAFPGSPLPATVVVRSSAVGDPAQTQAFAAFKRAALATGKLHEPITEAVHADKGIAVISVTLDGTGTDAPSVAALNVLRGQVIPATLGKLPGAEVDVAGDAAASVDFSNQLSHSALPVFAFVIALAFALMLISFRSVVIAITAALLNLLSVGAAYGALTLVFQHGVGASLIGARTVGAITSWLPLFLFVILFGLSMDYHVFVVSRIKEGHDQGLDTKTAVARGIGSTAGVVSSAALIMVGVFAIFGTLSVTSMKEVGVGLAVAVLVDATVIRGVLLPSVMTLLGERNWRRSERHTGTVAPQRPAAGERPGAGEDSAEDAGEPVAAG